MPGLEGLVLVIGEGLVDHTQGVIVVDLNIIGGTGDHLTPVLHLGLMGVQDPKHRIHAGLLPNGPPLRILGGSLIIEGIFGIPGVGGLTLKAITGLDYNIFILST